MTLPYFTLALMMYQYLGYDPAESSSMWLESKYKHFSLINHVKIPTAKIVQSRGSAWVDIVLHSSIISNVCWLVFTMRHTSLTIPMIINLAHRILWCCPLPCLFYVQNPLLCMMTSSNGNIFHVTGHLCGQFTGHRWIPRTKASDAELWYFLWSE